MGCYHSIQIYNPKKGLSPYLDKSLLTVPCGHCEGCKAEKRLAWFVRSYYEFLRCTDNGGFVYYLTLTYNENTVPKIGDDRVFCKNDIENYIEALRLRIKRKLQKKHYDSQLKFFYSGEYGGKTYRPHYHILFYCNDPINKWLFRKYANDIWRKEYGFVKAGCRNYGFVDSPGALHYVAKYVCKDISDDLHCFKLYQKHLPFEDKSVIKECLTSLNVQIIPPHRSSNDYGIYVLQCEDFINLVNGFVILPDSHTTIKRYKLPLYLERKIFYDVVKDGLNPVYKLNTLGFEMKLQRKLKFENAFKYMFTALTQQRGHSVNLDLINKKFQTNFDTHEQLNSFIQKKATLSELTDYVTTYGGYAVSPDLFSVGSTYDHDLSTSFYNARYSIDSRLQVLQRSSQNFLNYDYKNSFAHVVQHFNTNDFPFIVDIIRYHFYLFNIPNEEKKQRDERSYVDRKTIYLKSRIYELQNF